jgi:ribosomal protein S18 acetylase RimI-like enzyme
MVQIKRATGADRAKIEQLIAEYHASEHVVPRPERIAWAVRQVLRKSSIGILLVAHEKKTIRGVALGTFQPSAELGLTLTIHDFYVEPSVRRKGVGNELAKRLLKEARAMNVDDVDLEILPTNTGARAFWESIGFRPSGRILYSKELWRQRSNDLPRYRSGQAFGRCMPGGCSYDQRHRRPIHDGRLFGCV